MVSFFKSLFGGSSEEKQVNADKKNFDILKYDGLRALRMGKVDYAVKCLCEALKLADDVESMNYLNQIYIQTDELEKSTELLKRMTELYPEAVENFLLLAQVYYMRSQYAEMEQTASQATKVDGESAPAYFLWGKAMHAQNNDLMAIAHLTKAIVLRATYTEALLLRAEILLKMGQLKEAGDDLEVLLAEMPDEEAALLLKGKVKEAEGNDEEAEVLYHKVIEQNPFHEQAFVQLGQLFIRQNKLTEAIELFDDAIELNPNCIEAYKERGRAKLLMGDKEGSADDMKTALELHPESGEALNGTFSNKDQGPKDIWQM